MNGMISRTFQDFADCCLALAAFLVFYLYFSQLDRFLYQISCSVGHSKICRTKNLVCLHGFPANDLLALQTRIQVCFNVILFTRNTSNPEERGRMCPYIGFLRTGDVQRTLLNEKIILRPSIREQGNYKDFFLTMGQKEGIITEYIRGNFNPLNNKN